MAEPVQYCKFGERPNEDVDFCMGVTMHHNLSTNSYDMFLTMLVPRYGGSALGWTSIGLGETMTGSLMFFIYGDPLSYEDPIVSIRGSTGHSQPKLLTSADMGGADIRLLRSSWLPTTQGFLADNPTYIATASLVCYSCSLWPGTQISALSNSQPWIWAWNNKQDIQGYTYDVHLTMHTHHAGHGGFGNFYVDMSRSVNTYPNAPSFPPIRPHVASLGASESPNISQWITHSPALHLHGLFMGLAFLVIFPAGVIAMRFGSSKSFKYHWMLQLGASIFTTLGFIAGLLLDKPIASVHQGVGIGITSLLGIQGILGWRHHMDFLRIHRRTWVSHMHLWLGRAMMIAGWSNLVTGMLFRGYKVLCVVIMAVVVCTELIGLTFWIWWRQRISTHKAGHKIFQGPLWKTTDDSNKYFALGEDDDEGSETDEKSEEKKMLEVSDIGTGMRSDK